MHFVFTFNWGVLKYVFVTILTLYCSLTAVLQNSRKILQEHSVQAQPFSCNISEPCRRFLRISYNTKSITFLYSAPSFFKISGKLLRADPKQQGIQVARSI